MKSRNRQGIETHPGRGVKWGTGTGQEGEKERERARESASSRVRLAVLRLVDWSVSFSGKALRLTGKTKDTLGQKAPFYIFMSECGGRCDGTLTCVL